MTEHAVVIAGGGPTGLMLAGELALAGADVAVAFATTRARPRKPWDSACYPARPASATALARQARIVSQPWE
jgi:2-polyprenyl-6-methoxyphenol hydroxylase-like FAD-dependent oxidoreductase